MGQQRTSTDQRGTVHTFYYDKLGRLTNDCVTTSGTGVDTTILQIATVYEIRGLVYTVTTRNSATQGGGTAKAEVLLYYNGFGQLIEERQEHAVGMIGSIPSVYYGYDTGASGSNEIRPATLTYPNGRVITFSYGTTGGMNDYLNRIDTIQDTTSGTTDLASYSYLGSGMVINIEYSVPGIALDLWGGMSGVFSGFDQFNRIIDQRWET